MMTGASPPVRTTMAQDAERANRCGGPPARSFPYMAPLGSYVAARWPGAEANDVLRGSLGLRQLAGQACWVAPGNRQPPALLEAQVLPASRRPAPRNRENLGRRHCGHHVSLEVAHLDGQAAVLRVEVEVELATIGVQVLPNSGRLVHLPPDALRWPLQWGRGCELGAIHAASIVGQRGLTLRTARPTGT